MKTSLALLFLSLSVPSILTAASGTSVPITNPGFETIPANTNWISCVGNGGPGSGGAGCRDTLDGNVPGWTASNTTSIGLFQPGPNYFTLPLPTAEGQTVGSINSGTLSQTLSTTLQVSTLYTLNVDIGRRLDNQYPSSGPTVQLYAGTTLIATATGTQPALGGWTTWTATYQSKAADPLAGQALKIVLTTTAAQGDFDNVQLTSAAASGTPTSSNLIKNGDAEAGPGGGDFDEITTIPNWNTDGNVAVTIYASGYDLDPNSPGPTNRGNNYFAGGRVESSAMTQTIDLSAYASTIDAHTQTYTLDGWLGGYDGQDDNAEIDITFQTASGGFVGAASIGPVMSSDRSGSTELLEKKATGIVPVGTRKVLITVTFTRLEGTDNDGMADNLSLTLGGGTTTCSYALSATTAAPSAAGGTASVNVTAASGCNWTAVSNATWITITGGSGGSGNGTVTYSVSANTGTSRMGTVTIASLTYTVTQAAAQSGCSYNVNPTDIHATAAGLSGTLLIFTNSGCSWSSTIPSGASWITLNPSSGSGQGAAGYSIAANTGVARNTTITVAGVSVTVEEDAAPSCSYTLSSTSDLVPGLGGAGATQVTVTGSNCAAWTTGAPAVNWLHVTSPASQTGTGTVSYSVDPNPGPGQRYSSLSIAGATYTVTEDVPPCAYSLSASAGPTVSATGGTGSVQLTASSTVCPWSTTMPTDSTKQWVHITTASNGAGSSGLNYTADPNPTTSPRSLTFTVNGQKPPAQLTYTVNQAGGSANTGPVPIINPGGLVNAASFISASLPAGAIAQGSFFSIFGTGLGPDATAKANSYPLQTTLGGVSVTVKQGSVTVAAIPVFVAPFQINAVMPSNAPVGTVQVTVTYNGATSPPATGQVAVTTFGAFSVSGGRGPGIVQNYVSPTQLPLNMSSVTAAPGDTVILWGTGLGPLPNGASDSQPPAAGSLPVSVQITLGSQSIQPAYAGRAPGLAGVDQINFVVPSNAQLGCYVPLQVIAAGITSNTVTMAVNQNRQPCSDVNPMSAFPRAGGKNATIVLSRLTFTDASKAANNGALDAGLAIFEQQAAGGDLGFDLYSSLPPRNTCTAYSNMNALNAVLVGGLPATGTSSLNAGSTLTISGSNGARAFSYSDPTNSVSPYFSLLGGSGSIATSGLTDDPPFLNPGAFTLSGNGGKDVGPFSFAMNIANGATWTNRDQLTTVDRTKDLTITWSGGDPSKQVGVIIGIASNSNSATSGGFACLETLDKTSLTVPASMLANFPATTGSSGTQGGLFFLTFPSGDQFTTFNTSVAPSLDNGVAMFVAGDLRSNVTFK